MMPQRSIDGDRAARGRSRAGRCGLSEGESLTQRPGFPPTLAMLSPFFSKNAWLVKLRDRPQVNRKGWAVVSPKRGCPFHPAAGGSSRPLL